jgi:hypothetical protein
MGILEKEIVPRVRLALGAGGGGGIDWGGRRNLRYQAQKAWGSCGGETRLFFLPLGSMTVGPDGALWLTAGNRNRIVRFAQDRAAP